jgi:hypothetical protein
MTSTLEHGRAAKLMHSGDLTRKERLTLFDEDEVARVTLILADDESFGEKAQRVAAANPHERMERARYEATSYAPYGGARQDWFVELFLIVADETWRAKGWMLRDFLSNRHRRAVWAETELDESDPRRQRERWPALDEGGRAIARFGAGKCIGCGTRLGSDRYERGASGKRSRRTHCDPCKDQHPGRTASQIDAMRKAFDLVTGARRRRRVALRATPFHSQRGS